MPNKPFKPPPGSLFPTLYRLGLGPLVGRLVLLLTSTGRKTGLPRTTALQYEEVDGNIIVASARGIQADWVRNLAANPRATVRVKSRRFAASAEIITDPQQITDFLELRLARHPRMVAAIMKADGLPARPTRAELEAYAARLAMVILKPE